MTVRSLSPLVGALVLSAAACGRGTEPAVAGDATPATAAVHARFASPDPRGDSLDAADAARGLVATPTGRILGPDSSVLVDFGAFAFLDAAGSPTVNPSLWRHARLNARIGLFKVAEGIHQLRGFDLANMTLIDGAHGWIVVDPLTSAETAAAALAFARAHLGDRPVSAVVFTHSHIDHFGGVLGILTAEEAAARRVPVVAPAGFMDEATSENVLVGTAMARRAAYQFGKDLPRDARGFVDAGLGKGGGYGTFGILAPTVTISGATQEEVVDGVRFVFHSTPGAEAPAELTFSLPDRRAYCGAELVTQTMHNLLPLRGAKVRDARQWSRYLDDAIGHAAGAEVLFASHSWPTWGQERITALLEAHRDTYRYIHDQTVRLMNAGYTIGEVADRVTLPASLQAQVGARGYYGDVRHNARAVFQFYLGAYDGNPARLDALPPEAAAPRYVALMGGADRVVEAAQAAFDGGDYRWAAELLDRVVFAEPGHAAAKALLARTYEQMGYAAESATWRNAYLAGARELREGPPTRGQDRRAFLALLAQTPVERFLDAMAAGLDGPAAEGKAYVVNLVLTDTRETHVLRLRNAVLHHRAEPAAADADATLALTKAVFVRMMAGDVGVRELLFGDDVRITGSRVDLLRFLSLIDKAPGTFAIVTP